MGLNIKMMEILGRTAYEKHIGLNIGRNDGYFKKDFLAWGELPKSTQNHWINIAGAIIEKDGEISRDEIDCGDLD